MTLNQGLAVFGMVLAVFGVRAEEPDWRAYGELLQRHVHQGVRHGVSLALVDYGALKQNGALEPVYRDLAAFSVERLASREERLAFYINAYNILALKTVLDHWQVGSIKDAGSLLRPVWKRPAGDIGGKSVSLDEIENEVLRPEGEPRIHLAIVCASVSCPDLRNEPYEAARLNAQLDDQARRFLENPGKGLRQADGRIRVSKILDWFSDDFDRVGGVDAFVRRYKPGLPALPVAADMAYDWSVNAE